MLARGRMQRRRGRDARAAGADRPSSGEAPDDAVPVAIETDRGLVVACLRAAGRRSTPSTRCRCPGTGNGTASPAARVRHGDSFVLADMVRTDRHTHRPLPADSPSGPRPSRWWPAPARRRLGPHPHATAALTSLREYYPGFLAAFDDPAAASCAPKPCRPGRRAHPGATQPRSPSPSCAACCAPPAAPGHRRRGHPAARGVPRRRRCASSPARRGRYGPPALALLGRLNAACAAAGDLERPGAGYILTCTRTPGSSPAPSRARRPSPAPGCSPRSATTDPGSRMPKASGPTPAPPPSPAPPAEPGPSPPAASGITG